MNFEVMCFDFIDDSLTVVQKEYFDTLEEAIYFEKTEGLNYEGGTSIVPMNEWAENQMSNRQKPRGVAQTPLK